MDPAPAMNERNDEFVRIVDALREAGIPFMLVGGLALSAHHYERTTHDIDFFCMKKLYPQFDAVMKQLGYGLLHEPTDLYVRYTLQGRSIVDFIFSNEHTFALMENASQEVPMLGATVRVPSLDHLLSMKLFALEQGKRLKDMADISELLKANHVDPHGEAFEKLCLKFASEKWLKFFREMQ
jgi:hypothetical protein